jgi:hypothetical protein
MPVTYETNTRIIDTDRNNSITVTVPSGLAEGDLWLIYACLDCDAGTINTPSGWVDIGSQFGVGPINKLFYKIAGASESSVAVTSSGGDYDSIAFSVRISGVDTTTPISAVGTPNLPSGNGTTIDAPDVSVARDGSLAILVACSYGTTGQDAITKPSTASEINTRAASAEYPACGIAYEAQNTGSYAPGNWTLTTSDGQRAAQTFIIQSAAAGGATDQEGFRFRNDDGDEAGATFAEAQDTNITAPLDTNLRMRFIVDGTGDPAATQYQLEAKLSTESDYWKVS